MSNVKTTWLFTGFVGDKYYPVMWGFLHTPSTRDPDFLQPLEWKVRGFFVHGSHGIRYSDTLSGNLSLLLMGEIGAKHLRCNRPSKQWDNLPINSCRISSINSIPPGEKRNIINRKCNWMSDMLVPSRVILLKKSASRWRINKAIKNQQNLWKSSWPSGVDQLNFR